MNRTARLGFPLLLALVAVLGVGLGGGGLFLYQQLNPAPAAVSSESQGQRLAELQSFGKTRPPGSPAKVAALGRLQPKGDVIDISGLMGDRVGRLEVEEGAQVKKGDPLGYLESNSERQAEEKASAAQLAEAKERLEAETAYSKTQIEEAQIAVRQAEQLDPLDIEAQEARVRLLEAELATATTDLERLRSLTTPGAVPPQRLDQQQQLVTRFQQELIAAQATLKKAQAGRKLNLAKAQAQLQGAEAGLQRVKASAQIDSLTQAHALAVARLARTILKAPRDGTVLKILSRPGERADQKPILKLGDTGTMYAVAEVYETDALRVHPGQRATITSPALPRALTGTVERVGQLIYKKDVLSVDPAADSDARVVEVWIRLDPSEEAARLTNLQVDVQIDLTQKNQEK